MYNWNRELCVYNWIVSGTVATFAVVQLKNCVCVCVCVLRGRLYVKSPLRGASGILGISLKSCFARGRSCCIVGLVLLYE